MPAHICRTCGVQYPPSDLPPAECVICNDARQYVGWGGQEWTTLDRLTEEGLRSDIRTEEPGLLGIGVEPTIGIGQRSLLVETDSGNVLWDVPGYVDEAAIRFVADRGGLAAVSASHPHFYGVIAEWADAFDAPIVLPAADRRWLVRPARKVEWYDDIHPIGSDVTLVRTGGHFPGSAVLHWTGADDGRGVILTGDSVAVVQDRDWVSFMWSYPNLIPLDANELGRIEAALAPFEYDRVYGGWWGRAIARGAESAVARSLERYRTAITDTSALEP